METRQDNCQEIFISQRKPYKKINDRGIQVQINRIVNRTDINQKISPKTFRTTFANNLIRNGCPMNFLNALLGNKDQTSPAETIIKITLANINEIYEKYFST